MNSFKPYTVITIRELNQDPVTKALVQDFIEYKNGKVYKFPIFGRDAEFSEHSGLRLSQVSKVHVLSEKGMYNENKSQYDNTCDSCHLVYCSHHLVPEFLCVIAILRPDAHKKARDNNIIDSLLKKAESFQNLDPKQYLNKTA